MKNGRKAWAYRRRQDAAEDLLPAVATNLTNQTDSAGQVMQGKRALAAQRHPETATPAVRFRFPRIGPNNSFIVDYR